MSSTGRTSPSKRLVVLGGFGLAVWGAFKLADQFELNPPSADLGPYTIGYWQSEANGATDGYCDPNNIQDQYTRTSHLFYLYGINKPAMHTGSNETGIVTWYRYEGEQFSKRDKNFEILYQKVDDRTVETINVRILNYDGLVESWGSVENAREKMSKLIGIVEHKCP